VLAGTEVPPGDATKLTVVCAHPEQIQQLHNSWEEFLEKKQTKDAGTVVGRVAAYDNNSVNNLSSIVVLVESSKRILLCGDARGDHVLDGLKLAGLAGLADAHGVLDVLKLPHHGSIRNVEADLFKRLPAQHHVISANGRDGNPETETLDMIVDANDTDDFTIHLTNDIGKGLQTRIPESRERWKAAGREFEIVVRDPAELGLSVHLGYEQP
jgi:hypothetical protein